MKNMKNITEEELYEYMEFKKFMANDSMSMEELDNIAAARGNEDFTLFMQKIKEIDKEDE